MAEYDLIITFNKSSSLNYEKVIKIAKKFTDFKQEEKTNILNIGLQELLEKRNTVHEIFSYIGTWKHTSFSFNGKTIIARDIQYIFQVLNCSNGYKKAYDKKTYCYIDGQSLEGWHCKNLTYIRRHFPESLWEYKCNHGKYWFNFGKFNNKGQWVIDKKSLAEALQKSIEYCNVRICPYFDEDYVKKIISKLPDSIDLRHNKEWAANEKSIDDGFTKTKIKIGIIPKKLLQEDRYSYTGVIKRLPLNKNQSRETRNRYIPKTTFDDIGGIDDILIKIREIIELPIKNPGLFKHLGIKPHKGILLYGEPGCGKTLIAKAIAHEVKAHFISIKGPELINSLYGQTEENLRKIFEEARINQPSIIFFDEIDALAPRRSSNENRMFDNRFVNQLLTLMDGIEDYGNIRVLASTNRKELLDEAFLRSGRIDYDLKIEKPTEQGCKQIFNIHTKNKPIDPKFDKDLFSKKLVGLSGADIAFIVVESGYNCIRRNEGKNLEDMMYIEADFELALKMKKFELENKNTN